MLAVVLGALLAVAVAALLVDGAAASTTAASPSGAYGRCLQQAQTTRDTADCNAVELRRVDRLLNEVYRRLRAGLSPSRRALLTRAEERWIAFRDDECAFAASAYEGGSLAPIEAVACRIRLTAERTAHLRRHLRP